MDVQLIKTDSIKLYVCNTSKGEEISPKVKRYLKKATISIENWIFCSKNCPKELKRVKEFELNLTLCGRYKIRSLNKFYRQKDKITDVLSFPVHNFTDKDDFKVLGPLTLGDIFICKEVAKSQSKEFEISLEAEIVHLLMHGFLHLLGYDHEQSLKDDKFMKKLEDELFSFFKKRK